MCSSFASCLTDSAHFQSYLCQHIPTLSEALSCIHNIGRFSCHGLYSFLGSLNHVFIFHTFRTTLWAVWVLTNAWWQVSLLCYQMEYFDRPKNHVFHLSNIFPFPIPKKPLTSFFLSLSVSFPECHIIRNIQHVAFTYWLLTLNNMHLVFLQVFLKVVKFYLWTTFQCVDIP